MVRLTLVGLAVVALAAAVDPTPVTFSKDVLPILQKNCQSCHRPGQVAPMSLLSYQDARPWARAIKNAVIQKKMPPWFADATYGHFTNDRSLSQHDIETLAKWADTGASEGDPHAAPPAIEWPKDAWTIQPEEVMELPPHDVPAKGVLEWELIAFPAPFKGDAWLTSMEILPGAAEVVHHICFSFESTNRQPCTTATSGCTFRATPPATPHPATADSGTCRT